MKACRFNGHLATCLVLHSDEGFWAGEKAAEGVLKDLITNDEQLIELKGREPFRIKNFTRLIITTNMEWVVPTSYDERRFLVLDASDEHKQDHVYFAALEHERSNGGVEALLDVLQHVDCSNINLRKPPATDALFEQKLDSMHSFDRWWFEILQRGILPRTDYLGKGSGGWQEECSKDDLLKSYTEYDRHGYDAKRSGLTKLGMRLRKLVPQLKSSHVQITLPTDDNKTKQVRVPGYIFPDLARCRGEFEKIVGHTVQWDDGCKAEQQDTLFDQEA